MANPYFQFKQFTVWHDQCAMRVNTDGVLLGAWAAVEKDRLILDVGTGTGLVALMVAQRSQAGIHAVEIEENAFKQACSNIQNSPWTNRIEVMHSDFIEYVGSCSLKYSHIVANPPYFSNSLKNPNPFKSIARHNESLPLSGFLKGVSRILSDGGMFSVILPENTAEFENEAFLNGLKCTRQMLVRPFPGAPVKRRLIEFQKTENLPPVNFQELNIRDEAGNYSYIYIELTRNFYLNF